jgi:hypothetical protein
LSVCVCFFFYYLRGHPEESVKLLCLATKKKVAILLAHRI